MKSLTFRAAEIETEVAFLENRSGLTPAESAQIAALRSEAFSLRQCAARVPAAERMAERLLELDDEIECSREAALWFLAVIRRSPREWAKERHGPELSAARRSHGAACAERAAVRKASEERRAA